MKIKIVTLNTTHYVDFHANYIFTDLSKGTVIGPYIEYIERLAHVQSTFYLLLSPVNEFD